MHKKTDVVSIFVLLSVVIVGFLYQSGRAGRLNNSELRDVPVMDLAKDVKVEPAEFGTMRGERTTYTIDAKAEDVASYYKWAMPFSGWSILLTSKQTSDPHTDEERSAITEKLHIPIQESADIWVGRKDSRSFFGVAVLRIWPASYRTANRGTEVEVFVSDVAMDWSYPSTAP